MGITAWRDAGLCRDRRGRLATVTIRRRASFVLLASFYSFVSDPRKNSRQDDPGGNDSRPGRNAPKRFSQSPDTRRDYVACTTSFRSTGCVMMPTQPRYRPRFQMAVCSMRYWPLHFSASSRASSKLNISSSCKARGLRSRTAPPWNASAECRRVPDEGCFREWARHFIVGVVPSTQR
jgi:hypothetical protein